MVRPFKRGRSRKGRPPGQYGDLSPEDRAMYHRTASQEYRSRTLSPDTPGSLGRSTETSKRAASTPAGRGRLPLIPGMTMSPRTQSRKYRAKRSTEQEREIISAKRKGLFKNCVTCQSNCSGTIPLPGCPMVSG